MEKEPSYTTQAIQSFTPSEQDIWGEEFDPPYRFIYENQTFNQQESSLFKELKASEFFKKLDSGYWTDANLVRWIQGSNYNLQLAEKNIELHNQWRATIIPNKYLIDNVNNYLVI